MSNIINKLFDKIAEQSGMIAEAADSVIAQIVPGETAEAARCTPYYYSSLYCCWSRWYYWRMVFRDCYKRGRWVRTYYCKRWRYC